MPHKKKQDAQPAEDQALIDKVDAMMDLKRSNDVPVLETVLPPSVDEPIDIFKDLKTAPPLATKAELTIIEAPIETSTPEPIEEEEEPEPEVATPMPASVKVPEHVVQRPIIHKPLQAEEADVNDITTDQIVDEIIVADSDALLAAEDIVQQQQPTVQLKKSGLFGRFKKSL